MGDLIDLDQVRLSAGSRAARSVRSSAVIPASTAISVLSTAAHHSAGKLSRCHHLETAEGLASISPAIASREGQRSMMDWNDDKSVMPNPIRQLVLNCKDKLSGDVGITSGHNVLMSKKPSDSEFKRAFLARTAAAREKADYTQETMAAALGMEQSKYSKYEIRSMLPHALMIQFCALCHIDMAWLYTAAIEIPAAKPKRRRRPRKLKAA
jgi:DNA-binding XRE family transcriptional regulator